MKKFILKKSMTATFFLLLLFSCKKYEQFQQNPNEPSTATPALLMTNICYNIFDYYPTNPAYASRHLTYYERSNTYVNYGWTRGGFGNYDLLRQIKKMDDLAVQGGNISYTAISKFFRAVLFDQLTEQFGDIPYTFALGALEGNVKPAYDSQEDVFAGILNELEEANDILSATNASIGGDIIYAGNTSKWRKLINAYHLRLLIHLSKKEGSSKINIKEQFQNMVGNPAKYPLMESGADNGQLVFNTSATSNYYPTSGSLSIATAVSMELGFVDLLKATMDPRLFSFAAPIKGLLPNVFANYAGVNAGLTIASQQTASAKASGINSRYYDLTRPLNEPLMLMGFPEQSFIIAEGISRGWIAGDAADYYYKGITASMAFYGIPVPAGYLNQPNVKFEAANAIPLISTQKYISLYMQSGLEAFYEQRRTGIPHFNTGPGTFNDGKIPKRWQYPQSEYDYNAANLETAIKRQFTVDDVNEEMWLIK